MGLLDDNRLFPVEPHARSIARELYEGVAPLPIVSPHGHTDPAWFAKDGRFSDPADLFVTRDHYVFRMLHSQGVCLRKLGVPDREGRVSETDPQAIWRLFAEHFYLFRGTPSEIWINHVLAHVFEVEDRLNAGSADAIYAHIDSCLAQAEFRPRALFDRFGIEVLATTDAALDPLDHHRAIAASTWGGRVVPTYRPDAIVDPDALGFGAAIAELGRVTGRDTQTWSGYLSAHRDRRSAFIAQGATATDHGHPEPMTADLSPTEAEALFAKVLAGDGAPRDHALFRAQMLTEMAAMSCEDGLVMQIHPGSWRNHSPERFAEFGADKGFDIPRAVDYTASLRPLLAKFGNDPRFNLIVFTLDEATYARELAPLAGVYPALKLGPAWWFFDSAEGMRRYREATTETAGFYNTVGFNDDTRAFCSIPARHDFARRADCAYLATLVASGRLHADDAAEVAYDLSYRLAKEAYKL